MSTVTYAIGRRIREKRVEVGLTPEQLAVAAGFTAQTVRNIERGLKVPRVSTVERIAKVLGLSLTDLFDEPETAEVV